MDKKSLEELQLLIRQELADAIEPLRKEFRDFRDETRSSFDVLFQRDEKAGKRNSR